MKPRWDPPKKIWTFSREGYRGALRRIQSDSPIPTYLSHTSDLSLLPPTSSSQRRNTTQIASESEEESESSSESEEEEGEVPVLRPAGRSQREQQQKEQRQQKRKSSSQRGEASSSFPRALKSECDRRIRTIQPLWSKLYEFQREAVQFGLQRGGRVLLADEMGLGKTIQALALAACYKGDWPMLIVAPSTMKLVWKEAIRAWLPPAFQPSEQDLVVVKDGKSGAAKISALGASSSSQASSSDRPRIVIVSYDMVKRLLKELIDLSPNVIIADESHHLKTLSSQRTAAMAHLVNSSPRKRIIFISGTPALSRPLELYPQISMLRPDLFGTLDEFGMKYCAGKPALDFRFASSPNGMDYKGASNTAELRSRLEKDIFIRREKAAVLTELPEKIRKRIPIDISARDRRAVNAVKEELTSLERCVESGSMNQAAAETERQRLISEFYRVTGPAKVTEAVQHIQSLVDAGQKVIVFGHHKEVLDGLQQNLKFLETTPQELEDDDEELEIDENGAETSTKRKKTTNGAQVTPVKSKKTATAVTTPAAAGGRKRKNSTTPSSIGFVRIDGSVTELRRKAAVDAFQNDPAVRAAILSINAAGIGLTLTAATVVVFVELWWTPAALIQAEDRAHRLGQRGDLEVHYLTAADTADDLMWRMIQEKLGVVSSLVGGVDGSGGGASGSKLNSQNLFRDIKYAKRYENVQQRLAEQAERELATGGGRAVAVAGASTAANPIRLEEPCISDASTIANPGANYAEVFEGQQQQPLEESVEVEEEEETSGEVEVEEEEEEEESMSEEQVEKEEDEEFIASEEEDEEDSEIVESDDDDEEEIVVAPRRKRLARTIRPKIASRRVLEMSASDDTEDEDKEESEEEQVERPRRRAVSRKAARRSH